MRCRTYRQQDERKLLARNRKAETRNEAFPPQMTDDTYPFSYFDKCSSTFPSPFYLFSLQFTKQEKRPTHPSPADNSDAEKSERRTSPRNPQHSSQSPRLP